MSDIVFEVYSWGRTENGIAGNKQYITSNKDFFVNNDRVKTISDDEYNKVIKFIQEKMVGHNYISNTIFDYGCKVKATFEEKEISVSNVEPLYEDALLLFKAISGQNVTPEDISKIENKYQEYNYNLKKKEIVKNSIFRIEKRTLNTDYEESLKIVTNDKLLYTASIYKKNDLKGFPNYDIKQVRILSDDEYDKILEYIQNTLIGKQYEYEYINNSITHGVYARYNDINFNCHNNLKLYKKCDKFLRKQIRFD